MNFLKEISVLILTFDEAPNIGRTLSCLKDFSEVVVLDSESTDTTADIVAGFPNARLVRRQFDQHASQWTYGSTKCGIERPWVLALDADYLVNAELVNEISQLRPESQVVGYRIAFRYCVKGRPLSGTLYPPAVALYRRSRARYVQHGHSQRLVLDGKVGELKARIDHDDRKSLARWFASQQRYARLEAEHLMTASKGNLRGTDRLRLLGWFSPILVFFYTLIVRRCLFDGWAGWLYVLQRTVAEMMIALELADRRLQKRRGQVQ